MNKPASGPSLMPTGGADPIGLSQGVFDGPSPMSTSGGVDLSGLAALFDSGSSPNVVPASF